MMFYYDYHMHFIIIDFDGFSYILQVTALEDYNKIIYIICFYLFKILNY